MAVAVVPYSDDWPTQFESIAHDLRAALAGIPVVSIEHVGSTAVPGLAAKPVLDIDIIVHRDQLASVIAALRRSGYEHQGDLGITDREALLAPDDGLRRHVYVCIAGTLPVRNHLAVRNVLRQRPDLRDRYAATKMALSADPSIDMAAYTEGKSTVLQDVLALSDLSEEERLQVLRSNSRSAR